MWTNNACIALPFPGGTRNGNIDPHAATPQVKIFIGGSELTACSECDAAEREIPPTTTADIWVYAHVATFGIWANQPFDNAYGTPFLYALKIVSYDYMTTRYQFADMHTQNTLVHASVSPNATLQVSSRVADPSATFQSDALGTIDPSSQPCPWAF
jgi:hypothetical protein